MTYCVGLMLERGLVMMSDTRTNAGVDNVSTFGKMFTWEKPGERALVLMTAGNLATTQSVVSILDERTKAHGERDPSLFEAPSMFQAARLVAATLKDVIAAHADVGQRADASFNATLILGGQIKGGAPRLFLIYPEGNFIEAGVDTPFFQIGETKYGRPILVRAYDAAMSFEKAVKVMLVSFDSTLKANLSVGMPFDLQIYETDSLQLGRRIRIDPQDAYFERISTGWGEALKSALDSLPDFEF
ncbi:proteasome-type protease [Rhodovulum sulfidophilum]|uniref:proteasome-type protease n=1 Tax=Rhodovulum sulfidophilum TaxID=35806 RepID=UPI0005AAC0E4|nr:proteasome-type protease [Rhodovulum sulfidophilum]ANB35127.1 peptidase [Rhodovulum sulfidophilum DSM 1374]ANB38949.1 peptidase [Rhodovulum sulfidophilum]MBL3553120.1 proteasome-type protease [Rhodovulum sulfidophilum]MBL3561378.1 proteasome-type protease [Rhodovulum sulfidophilum]MBL3595311.1 proteasome-type protease [Rhodovulum sulfidophilum]